MGEEVFPYGVVNFITSCDSTLTQDFNLAVSKLYSFWYSEARADFDTIISRDANCCMAYWGAASSYNHPNWDFIEDDRLRVAELYMKQSSKCAANNPTKITDRELGYIKSMAMFVNTSDPVLAASPPLRLQTFVDAMKELVYDPFIDSDENAGCVLSSIFINKLSWVISQSCLRHITARQGLLLRDRTSRRLPFLIHCWPSSQRCSQQKPQ
jgi:hypothetical protein